MLTQKSGLDMSVSGVAVSVLHVSGFLPFLCGACFGEMRSCFCVRRLVPVSLSSPVTQMTSHSHLSLSTSRRSCEAHVCFSVCLEDLFLKLFSFFLSFLSTFCTGRASWDWIYGYGKKSFISIKNFYILVKYSSKNIYIFVKSLEQHRFFKLAVYPFLWEAKTHN